MINMIRHPVERFISHFNYKRNGDMGNSEGHKSSNYTIDECIIFNYKECDAAHASYMIPFFCGQGPTCKKATEGAYERAKQNMLESYYFIGITEQFDDTVAIMERLVPVYFRGLTHKWKLLG